MDSQLFLIANICLSLIFLIWFLRDRNGSGSRPTQLNLHAKSTENEKSEMPRKSTLADPEGPSSPARPQSSESLVGEKSLNVLFIYNGHDWDAYQVLGLPAGCSLTIVTERYHTLIKETADPGKREFLETAYLAILKSV